MSTNSYDSWKCTEPDNDRRPGYHCHRCGTYVTDDAPDYNPRREECGGCAERRLSIIDDAMENNLDDRDDADDLGQEP